MSDDPDSPDVTPDDGPAEPLDEPDVTDIRDEAFDYEAQDTSTLGRVRTADCEYGGVRFRFEEVTDRADAMGILLAAEEPGTLARRILATVVVRPDPLAPVLGEMTGREQAILATEAIDWHGEQALIDEVAARGELVERITDSFNTEPPTGR